MGWQTKNDYERKRKECSEYDSKIEDKREDKDQTILISFKIWSITTLFDLITEEKD